MRENVIQKKSYEFAKRIIKLYSYLSKEKKEFIISKQLLRSGTSIGANIEEAIGAQSKKDFVAKMNISYKEARETHYWIRLLHDTEILTLKEKESIIYDCEELIKILVKILKTGKS